MDIFTERRAELIAHIEADPRAFDMLSWIKHTSCGTTACAAGTAAMLAGWEPLNLHEVGDETDFVGRNDETTTVEEAGMDYLGLDRNQANLVFVWCSTWVKTATELRDFMAHVVDEHVNCTGYDAGSCEKCWGIKRGMLEARLAALAPPLT